MGGLAMSRRGTLRRKDKQCLELRCDALGCTLHKGHFHSQSTGGGSHWTWGKRMTGQTKLGLRDGAVGLMGRGWEEGSTGLMTHWRRGGGW